MVVGSATRVGLFRAATGPLLSLPNTLNAALQLSRSGHWPTVWKIELRNHRAALRRAASCERFYLSLPQQLQRQR